MNFASDCQILAGKPVPAHKRDRFSALINTSTGNFKNEFVQPLDTKEEQPRRSKRIGLP